MAAEAVGYAIEFRAGTAVKEVVTKTPRGKVSDGFGGAGGGNGAGANAGIFSFFLSTFILFIQCSHSAHNSSREVSQFQATLRAPIDYGIWG